MHKTFLFPELGLPSPDAHTTGILPSQRLGELLSSGMLRADDGLAPEQIQPASLDLRLSGLAYRVQASFLPGATTTVMTRLEELLRRDQAFPVDLSKGALLERNCVYIAQLQETLFLPSDISGKANPKSTTGRLDIFTRLIADYSTEFDKVAGGYKGPLYVEIIPRTFSIVVRKGTMLNQIRLMRGAPPPSDASLHQLDKEEVLTFGEDGQPEKALISKGLWLSVDLRNCTTSGVVGYRAKAEALVIDFDRRAHYDASDGWDELRPCSNGQLVLEPGHFYILASRERVRIPPTHAAEMIAYDPSLGEFRVHYAGFFDPGFGYGRDNIRGSRAVLEVRSHGVPFTLEHSQVVGRLVFERMLEAPKQVYGCEIGSSYQGQGLALAKQFRQEGFRHEEAQRSI